MSDLYCANLNGNKIPENPSEEMFLGSIDLDEHKLLEIVFNLCKKKGCDFPYFEDVYLESERVEEMLKTFESYPISEKNPLFKYAYKKMFLILRAASKKKCGIVSYCD